MGRPSKRALHLRNLREQQQAKRLRIEDKEQVSNEESDIESDDEAIDIPPFGLDEVEFLDFNDAEDRVSESVKFNWQRGSQPHRQTIWRHKKQARELESAARSNVDIRRFFAPQAADAPPTAAADAPPTAAVDAGADDLEEPTEVVVQSRQEIQDAALSDIKKALKSN